MVGAVLPRLHRANAVTFRPVALGPVAGRHDSRHIRSAARRSNGRTVAQLSLAVVLALPACAHPPLLPFEPPPVGAPYTTSDHELHQLLSDALHGCQRSFRRRQREDRIDRVLHVLYVLLATLIGGLAQARVGPSPPGLESTPCGRDRVAGLEDECVLQFVPGLHRGPTYDGRDGGLEDSPRARLDVRADVDAALGTVDRVLEARALDTLSPEARVEALRAIADLATICD